METTNGKEKKMENQPMVTEAEYDVLLWDLRDCEIDLDHATQEVTYWQVVSVLQALLLLLLQMLHT